MLVMVTGGRAYDNPEVVFAALDTLYADPDLDYVCVIQGGARGADRWARDWCRLNRIGCRTFKADWDRYGRRAGILRNCEMLDFGPPDLVLAFPGGSGTRHAVDEAKRRNIPVILVPDRA